MDVPPRLVIDDGAIARNVESIIRATGTPLMAVLKADAFGHGPQADVVLGAGASSIGVTTIEEALALRGTGTTAPILSWLNPVDADWAEAVRAGVDLAVPGLPHLFAIAGAALATGLVARVHLHLDVGMSRDGAAPEDWKTLMHFAGEWERRGAVRVVGVMAHLSSAQDPDDDETTVERMRFVNGCRLALRAACVRGSATSPPRPPRSRAPTRASTSPGWAPACSASTRPVAPRSSTR